jgi:hypothetical protein
MIQPCVPPQVVYLQVRFSNEGCRAAGTWVPLAMPAPFSREVGEDCKPKCGEGA